MRCSIFEMRSQMEFRTALATSPTAAPADRREMTSDSANTAHILLMDTALTDDCAFVINSTKSILSVLSMISINLPVPAAHRSFISNYQPVINSH